MNISKRVLSGLALLLVAAYAVSAVPCPHNRNIITCCASAKPTYSKGNVIRWTCNQCDDGYRRSSNGQQCIQQKSNQCGRGQGRDYYGNCAPCADDNCQTCSQLWTFCNQCKDGYVTNSNGQCESYDPCDRGEGLDYNGNCTPCVDDNCQQCAQLWTQCTKCNSGYGLNDDKEYKRTCTVAIECGYLMAARLCSTKQSTKAVQQQRQEGMVGGSRMGKTRKRRQVKEEIDIAYEYVGMKRAGMVMMSRSGRQVKPKVYADELVGDGAFLVQIDSKNNKDADIHSSAEDCESPIGEDTRRQIVGEDDGKKSSSGGRRGKSGKGSGGGIFKAAAVTILQEEGRLMSTGDIAKLALQRGLIKCSGKTPEATMASALYTDIKRKVGESTFIRPREGLFGLKEWEDRYTCAEEGACVGSSEAKNASSAHDGKGNANVNPYDTVDIAVVASREYNMREQQDGGASGGHGAVAPVVGSVNGGMERHNPPRDGLIDLWSAAEKIDRKKKRRKVLITAVDAPARVSLPVMRKKASIVADSVPQEQTSAGEKGSVVFKKEPRREEACVQSPRRETIYSHQHKDASICMDSEMCETMLFQLRLIRYCIENPNDSSEVCAESAVQKMEDTLKSYLTQITAQEDLNNRTADM